MKAPFLVLILLAVSLAGCTGGSGGDDFVTPSQDDQGRYVIEVGPNGKNVFSPAHASIPVNGTVVWKNVNGGYHNVAADDDSFRNGDPSVDAWEFEMTFTETGEWGFHCEPHRSLGMVGTLRIE